MKAAQVRSRRLLETISKVCAQWDGPVLVVQIFGSLAYREYAREFKLQKSATEQRNRISGSLASWVKLSSGELGSRVYLGYTITKAKDDDGRLVWSVVKLDEDKPAAPVVEAAPDYLVAIMNKHLPEVKVLLERTYSAGVETGKGAPSGVPDADIERIRAEGIAEGRRLERNELIARISAK